jgi:prepilin-type N-terminal cleavage/methylation domain-containing protein/prepilin-type processing-associated H-X9-DG protein
MEREKGFTLVELLVVIAIIALLMGILMPALARVRQIAYRLYCGTNLSGIGKAMLIYSNDFDDELPQAGFKESIWTATIVNWRNVSRTQAFNTSRGSAASITSNFFLLMKYAEVTPAQFLCKGDSKVKRFRLSETDLADAGAELIDCWDFGPTPQAHCSYSYQSIFGSFGLTSSSNPSMAMAADPNPWLASPAFEARPNTPDWGEFDPGGEKAKIKLGNARTHQEDGQNVVYVDGHVDFEKSSACGSDDDNVFTRWDLGSEEKQKGIRPEAGNASEDRADSLLLTDNNKY